MLSISRRQSSVEAPDAIVIAMVIATGRSPPLWLLLLSTSIFVLCDAKPQNYRFNQQPQVGGQTQYTTVVAPLVEGCIDVLSTGGFAFTGSVTMVQDNGCNIIIDTPAATDVSSKTKMLNGLVFFPALLGSL